MRTLFRYRWLNSLIATVMAAVISLLFFGAVDLVVLIGIYLTSALVLSYPSFIERRWQSRTLPLDTIHVPTERIRQGNDFALIALFDLPQIYQLIKSRYSLRSGDPASAGLFLYFYLPTTLYETRNVGPDTIYHHLARRLKADLGDKQELDLIAQRNLPLALGFRFLPKNGFPYHEFSKVIDVVKKNYYRENTRIRGVLQSKRRIFRMHTPDDNEWRTFQPYHEDSVLLYGGGSLTHDFRHNSRKSLTPDQVSVIDAERVEYPEKIPFGSLLTYAKKGEISLQGKSDAVDKLYIDRVNVLVQGTEHRKDILAQLSKHLQRDLGEEDFHPLFNYGQKLRGYLDSGKTLSDFVSSHGNFAIYYDSDKGWTVLKLEDGLELRLQEAYWSNEPKMIHGPTALSTSRATLITGSPDSLLRFQISTGTPTRGQIFAADEMIEGKIKSFAQIHGYKLVQPVGGGAEGCLYLAQQQGKNFYLKSPDGQLAAEEIQTIETLKKGGLIPTEISTFPEDRMIVMPEYQAFTQDLDSIRPVAQALLFHYLKHVWDLNYLCLDLTPEHVKIAPDQQKLFLIDFSGYAPLARYKSQPKELLADRKKIEYRTPEESVRDFRDAEKFQIFLIGLLFYQLSRSDRGLPYALKFLDSGPAEYEAHLLEDLRQVDASGIALKDMLGYDPSQRKNFFELAKSMSPSEEQIRDFWNRVRS